MTITAFQTNPRRANSEPLDRPGPVNSPFTCTVLVPNQLQSKQDISFLSCPVTTGCNLVAGHQCSPSQAVWLEKVEEVTFNFRCRSQLPHRTAVFLLWFVARPATKVAFWGPAREFKGRGSVWPWFGARNFGAPGPTVRDGVLARWPQGATVRSFEGQIVHARNYGTPTLSTCQPSHKRNVLSKNHFRKEARVKRFSRKTIVGARRRLHLSVSLSTAAHFEQRPDGTKPHTEYSLAPSR